MGEAEDWGHHYQVPAADLLGEADRARLQYIRDFVTDLWANGDQINPHFTLHGPHHSKQVERIIGHILGPEHNEHHDVSRILDQRQLLYLLASAWLHDVGMICPATEEEIVAAEECCLTLEEWIRAQHHIRSFAYVVSHSGALRLADTEAQHIGRICQAHREVDLFAESIHWPDVRLLERSFAREMS